jgi:hypothetical protein
MNLQHIKSIIKEQLRQLNNQKSLLNEDIVCETEASPIFDIECPDGSDGIAQSRRDTDCSWTTYTSCAGDGSLRPPRDGNKTPKGLKL